MKNITLLIILCLPLLSIGQNKNALNFESKNHDFGTISSNSQKAIATFQFTNTSKTPIEIVRIHGENHCLDIDSLSLKSYAPGEKGTITVTYNTECVGPIRKTLSVFTSKKAMTITLKLTGKVKA